MEKRYQVFISSTFQDLQNARQEVSQALLRADCFPAGMELFPAADEEQFEFIKTIIDQSDYYIIISAGRYGTIHPETGLSYTEMEYDYAVSIGKPIIRLLHKDPFNELKGEFIEDTAKGKRQLKKFRDKLCGSTLVKFWNEPRELMAETVFALQDIQRRKPATGWVPSDKRATDEMELELAKLQRQVAEFQLKASQIENSPSVEELISQSDRQVCLDAILLHHSINENKRINVEVFEGEISVSFYEMALAVVRVCHTGRPAEYLKSDLEEFFKNRIIATHNIQLPPNACSIKSAKLAKARSAVLHKLQALGVIYSKSEEVEITLNAMSRSPTRRTRKVFWYASETGKTWLSEILSEDILSEIEVS